MGWHLLETLLQQVGEHSTLVGKLWVTATFVFRFILVASVGDAVYSDEQSDFNCNTGQPGCENVCYNLFSPISHLRFWAAQIVAVSTPSIVFVVYAAHKLLQVSQGEPESYDDQGILPPIENEILPDETPLGSPKKRKAGKVGGGGRGRRPASAKPKESIGIVRGFANPPGVTTTFINDIKEEEEEDDENEKADDISKNEVEEEMSEIDREIALLEKMGPADNKEKKTKRSIQAAYVTALLLRTGSEAVFIWLQIKLYGFSVPELFKCSRKPCPNIVDCFISRPREKTIFLWFMFAVSSVCLALNIAEIKYLGLKRLKKVCLGTPEPLEEVDGEDAAKSIDHGSNASKDTYFNINEKGERVKPSAPSDVDSKDLYNVIKYPDENRDKTGDEDSIGFSMIGDRPSHPMPGYPYIHRYGMILNATPPPRKSESNISYI